EAPSSGGCREVQSGRGQDRGGCGGIPGARECDSQSTACGTSSTATEDTAIAPFDKEAVARDDREARASRSPAREQAVMSARQSALGAILIMAVCALPCAAQTVAAAPSAQTCDQKDADAKRAWASQPHGWLASVFHKEHRDIADSWCRIWEASGGRDRSFKAENFGRTLFTGDGIHPAVSSALVPGSGFAGGATFGVDRALASRPLRLSMSADVLASTNGS